MNIPISLYSGIGIAAVKGPIPITDDPMIVSVSCDHDTLKNVYVVATNEKKTFKGTLNDGVCVLPDELKIPGSLNLTFKKIINGEIIHIWSCESILLKDISGTQTAIPQITELKTQVSAMSEALAELKYIITSKEF